MVSTVPNSQTYQFFNLFHQACLTLSDPYYLSKNLKNVNPQVVREEGGEQRKRRPAKRRARCLPGQLSLLFLLNIDTFIFEKIWDKYYAEEGASFFFSCFLTILLAAYLCWYSCWLLVSMGATARLTYFSFFLNIKRFVHACCGANATWPRRHDTIKYAIDAYAIEK